MNIQDLKQEILNGTIDDNLIVFVCPDDSAVIAENYVDEICNIKNLSKVYISSLSETTESALSIVVDYTDNLNILRVDTFSERSDDYYQFKNCIVICKKLDKGLPGEINDFAVMVPKLTDWQIKDHILAACTGLTEADAEWLYNAANKNIYLINNEINKINLVDEADRSAMLKQSGNNLFAQRQVFDLVEALVTGDKATALEFLVHANDYTNLDPIGLTTLTLTKYKSILLVTYKTQLQQNQLGLSPAAIGFIRNKYKNIPLERIKKAIDFLSKLDSRLKENPSSLDFVGCRKTAMLEYVVLGALSCFED